MGIFQVDADDIRNALRGREVPELSSERKYEGWIYRVLHEAFPKDVFHRQYANAKTKADIYVELRNGGAKVVVEVKYKLTKRGEYHRLIGQAWEYLREWRCELVVCICGESDPALVKLTEEALSQLGSNQQKKAHVLYLKP